jgi:hypothetical protein
MSDQYSTSFIATMRDAGEGNGTSMTLLLDDHIGVHNKRYCGARVN